MGKEILKKIGFVYFLTMGISMHIAAQEIPGYLGKKNVIGYGTVISIGGKSSEITEKMGLVVNHHLSYERVLSRKTSVTGSISYAPSKFHLDYYQFNYNSTSIPASDQLKSFTPDYYVNGYMGTASIGLKFSRNQFVAPMGRYFKLSAGYIRWGLKNWREGMPGRFQVISGGTGQEKSIDGYLKPEKSFSSGYHFSLSLGKVVPISDKLMFEYGNNLNFLISSDYGSNLGEFGRSTTEASIDNYIYANLHRKIEWRHLLDFYFGLKLSI